MQFRTIAITLLLTCGRGASAQTNVVMYGANGTVGHGAIRVSNTTAPGTYGTYYNALPVLAPFQNAAGSGGRHSVHPMAGTLGLVVSYTRLTGAGAFAFTPDGSSGWGLPTGTGAFYAPGTHRPTAAHTGTMPSTINLPNGVTIGAGTQILSDFAGLQMDHTAAADYWMNSGTNIEHRVYRGGEWSFFYDQGAGNFAKFAGYTNVVVSMDINWSTGFVDVDWSGTPSAVNGVILPTTGTAHGNDPIDADGILTNEMSSPYAGMYGRFGGGLTFSFDVNNAVLVPEPHSLLLFPACVALALAVGRRRRDPAHR